MCRPTEDGDVDVVLFVKMKADESLSKERVVEIKKTIKEKQHQDTCQKKLLQLVIFLTQEVEKMELAVTRLISGKELTNI